MVMAEGPDNRSSRNEPAPHLSAEEARGGDIVMRSKWQRYVFIAGLVGFVLLAIFVKFAFLG